MESSLIRRSAGRPLENICSKIPDHPNTRSFNIFMRWHYPKRLSTGLSKDSRLQGRPLGFQEAVGRLPKSLPDLNIGLLRLPSTRKVFHRENWVPNSVCRIGLSRKPWRTIMSSTSRRKLFQITPKTKPREQKLQRTSYGETFFNFTQFYVTQIYLIVHKFALSRISGPHWNKKSTLEDGRPSPTAN